METEAIPETTTKKKAFGKSKLETEQIAEPELDQEKVNEEL